MRCSAKGQGASVKPIYYDNHLLILEKPPGIATQPEFHEEARTWLKKEFAKPGNVFLEPIHRLDKPVGGIVLFARTSKALSRLNEAMRQRSMKKTYIALIEGELEGNGTLEHNLLHGEFKALVDPKGKQAILHYRVIENREFHSLVEVELETGRYHQIRAQFAAIGHPIFGDAKYGSEKKSDSIFLHHTQLILEHPTTKERLIFQSQAAFSRKSYTRLG